MNKRNTEQNTCDKCGQLFDSEELVWITADDFTPKEGEVVPARAFKMYDALCEDCYESILEIKNPKYFFVSAQISEDYPNYNFVVRARKIEDATDIAERTISDDYPDFNCVAFDRDTIKEITGDKLIERLLIN
jgi:hypothetical protein